MARQLNPRQLTGREETHLVELPCGHRLQAAAAAAFAQLQQDARSAGFDLAIASSFRSYSRQLLIWNGKASGLRKVHDDAGRDVDISALPAWKKCAPYCVIRPYPGPRAITGVPTSMSTTWRRYPPATSWRCRRRRWLRVACSIPCTGGWMSAWRRASTGASIGPTPRTGAGWRLSAGT